MKHVYTYRSVSGDDIQREFDGDVNALRQMYKTSCTPISSINGVTEDLTAFIQTEIDNVNRNIISLQKERKKLQDEQARRRMLKNR